ncbi:hypothetical protein [Terrihabitans rhizophilus]|uniref:Uncharacterized protein n=1 Tax=Terrihabitans rhizophilus TaxID=3092662 RepID=A0ABU4RSI7_9HYPH|nr:hypothetical protein [Terrihabitans sp. PJ23]MDX6807581.1 hypothetical protein [Terrihabitans sp. PJ23]
MLRSLRTCFLLAASALMAPAASAHPPAELQSYVGARAGQAELGIARLGYVNKIRNYWWHPRDAICVKFTVSQGRYRAIDIVKPSACGIALKALRSGDTSR